MIRCVIIDDEQQCLEALLKVLSENFKDIDVVATADNADDGIKAIQKYKPNLVFLDVVMPEKNGFEMLEEIDGRDFEIIFTTGYNQYAIRAIRFSALDYLMKPIDVIELSDALKRAEQKLHDNQPDGRLSAFIDNLKVADNTLHRVALPTTSGYDFVALKDIIRCESEGNYTHFYLADGKDLLVSRTLKEYEELLTPHNFFRVHHSHIVNLQKVTKYVKGKGGQVILSDGKAIGVSERKKSGLLERLKHM